MIKYSLTLIASLSVFLLTACAASEPPENVLRVMTHDSYVISDDVLAEFENQHNVRVQFLSSGDTGAALSKAIISVGNPIADVFYGLDNTFLSRALEANIFEPYSSPLLVDIPDEFRLDPSQRALPVDYGDVCINYDIGWFATNKLDPPEELADLLRPEYRGLLVVQDPAVSSPGLAFLLATIAHFGEDGYLDYWHALAANDVLVVSSWEQAYNIEFSYWGGQYPLVVSYGSSPAFEFIYGEDLDENPTGAMLGENACFRQIEFVGILAGTENRELAEKWIDFMLSPSFQEDMPLNMAVYPVNREAKMDVVFAAHIALPEHPASLDPALISAKREAWLQAWRDEVLR